MNIEKPRFVCVNSQINAPFKFQTHSKPLATPRGKQYLSETKKNP